MMLSLLVSPQAEQDIVEILAWTDGQFGERARIRYEALLERAIFELRQDPARPGSHEIIAIGHGVRTYHLLHSRDRVPKKIGRVYKPRHILLYRISSECKLEIGRVLHDGVDLARHLPESFRSDFD